ncbi:MAG: class I SAM-dependent methyltransferase [Gemmatimonadetes bacterium]|nr:class I SAM-dependent methyltransferase [Gemmatimonadota bacterium]
MTDWFESDDFWTGFGGTMFDAAAWEDAAEQVDRVEALLEIEPGSRVLDLCCGPGRHALELSRRGYDVLGVDRTERFLDEARRRADDEGLDLDLAQSDMREFVETEAFDVALNLFTSFGYFRDPADDRRVVQNLHDSLRVGGKLLMDMGGKEVIARIFEHKQWRERDGDFYLYERTITDDWGWIENRWIRIDIDDRQEFIVGHRLYSGVELKTLVADVGFTNVNVYGSLDGRPYDTEATRLVLSAEK